MNDRSRHGYSDLELLEIMHMRDHEGMRQIDIGARFGKSKNSMIGLTNRIDKATDASDPDGNQNGTMPPKWWKR